MRRDKEEIQGSDWQGPPMNKCSHLSPPPQMAMLVFVALLSEGPHGPADPRQNPREDPVLLVPLDRFVQAPQGNVESKTKSRKGNKTHSKTKLMKQKRVFYLYISLFFKKM